MKVRAHNRNHHRKLFINTVYSLLPYAKRSHIPEFFSRQLLRIYLNTVIPLTIFGTDCMFEFIFYIFYEHHYE